MDKCIIRECTSEDLDYVVSLQHQWVKEDITHGLIPVEKVYLETKLGKYFYVAELNSKIIGFVYGGVHTSDNMCIIDNGQPYIEVEDIYVSPDSRSAGLGSVLLDKVLSVAKDNGIERSMIYSSTKDMDNIIKFYKKHDYKTWCIQMFK
jgi:ribosomal protein S18 acetylase RimI-like enzyme